MPHSYTDPVAKLVTRGEADFGRGRDPWPDYLELELAQEHVSELIRMATDLDLHNSPSESLEIWAPLHAWRALGQLRAAEAAQPLVLLFERLRHDDWLAGELPRVFAMIGPSAIPALEAFLGDDGVEEMCRNSIPECLQRLAEDHPGERDACIAVLVRQLDRFDTNGPYLNGFLISGLIDLGATEAIGLIRQAFSENQVDLSIAGDVEDVEIEMGLRTNRSTPRPRYFEGILGSEVSAGDDMDDRALRNVPVRRAAKIGRNDPCPCGSGKKFKKCCLNDP